MKALSILFLSSARVDEDSSYFRCFYLSKYLVERGHRVSLIATSRKATSNVAYKLVDGVNVISLPSLAAPSSSLLPQLLSGALTVVAQTLLSSVLQATLDFDILHSFDVMFPQNAIPTLFSKISRFLRFHDRKILVDWDDWWGRGGMIAYYARRYGGFWSLMDPPVTFLEEKGPKYADAVTVATDSLKERALSVGVRPENIFIVGNGTNTDFIKPVDIHDARDELGLPEKSVICTHLGNVDLETFNLLMQAHKIVVRKHPNTLLLLVGSGPAGADFVRSLGMDKSVICFGRQPYRRVPLYLGASDICLMPMQDLSFNRIAQPLRLLDYLAAGRPVIATALPELGKIVRECGLLAKPGDPDDFADKILILVDNPNLRDKMGKRARELAETRYSWRIAAEQLDKAYCRYS
jgi:glycosyltransferase involved in cell wall biosynthesis